MTRPGEFDSKMRGAILIAIAIIVVIAPLIGVYAFSPLFFAGGIEPYQLAVTLAVMLAQAISLAALVFLFLRGKHGD